MNSDEQQDAARREAAEVVDKWLKQARLPQAVTVNLSTGILVNLIIEALLAQEKKAVDGEN